MLSWITPLKLLEWTSFIKISQSEANTCSNWFTYFQDILHFISWYRLISHQGVLCFSKQNEMSNDWQVFYNKLQFCSHLFIFTAINNKDTLQLKRVYFKIHNVILSWILRDIRGISFNIYCCINKTSLLYLFVFFSNPDLNLSFCDM